MIYNSPSGYIPKRLKAESQTSVVHCRIIHNRQMMEATQASVHRQVDKQNVIYTYNGISFSLKEEENSDTCYDMDEP